MGAFRSVLSLLGVVIAVLAAAGPVGAGEPCAPEWAPTFGEGPGFDGEVLDLCEFDDGSGYGLQIYAAGDFESAGSVSVARVARWDGQAWVPLGEGLGDGSVRTLAVFDDGSGNALFAGGDFITAGGQPSLGIAKWDGDAWTAVGGGIAGVVHDMCVFDDGDGPALFVTGLFSGAGKVISPGVIRWDGVEWESLDTGLASGDEGVPPVGYALETFDDGNGLALYVGGAFEQAGEVGARNVAKWDGQEWSALPGSPIGVVLALGAAPLSAPSNMVGLYAGGMFDVNGTPQALARWSSGQWTVISGLGGADGEAHPEVRAIEYRSHPQAATSMYIGGKFRSAGGMVVNNIATLSWGTQFNGLYSGLEGDALARVSALLPLTSDSRHLIAGGSFLHVDGNTVNRIARFTTSWSGFGAGIQGPVRAIAELESPGGNELFVGGYFRQIGNQPFDRIAKRANGVWVDVGGADGAVLEIKSVKLAHEQRLVAGGDFRTIGGVTTNYLAWWNGSVWNSFGTGFDNTITSVEVFDDGQGPALYAAGYFASAGGIPAARVAKWNGTAWEPLGQGLTGWVEDMCVFDDGHGPALYVCGRLTAVGAPGSKNLVRWNGQEWQAQGSGWGNDIYVLEIFDDGAGDTLYVGGAFSLDGEGDPAPSGLVRWNGLEWVGIPGSIGGGASAMCSFDDGSGQALFVGGYFTEIAGVPMHYLAKWDGVNWSSLGDEIPLLPIVTSAVVSELLPVAHETGAASLLIGGFFSSSPSGSAMLARYAGCAAACPADTNGDGVVNFTDLNAVLGSYGDTGANLPGDVNGDGAVDFADLNEVLSNFGISCR